MDLFLREQISTEKVQVAENIESATFERFIIKIKRRSWERERE